MTADRPATRAPAIKYDEGRWMPLIWIKLSGDPLLARRGGLDVEVVPGPLDATCFSSERSGA